MARVGGHLRRSVTVDQRGESSLADPVGRHLRHQIADTLGGCAHVGEDDAQQIGLGLAVPDEPHGRETQPFLVDLCAQRHGAGRSPADIAVMRAVGEVEGRAITAAGRDVQRRHQSEVGKVGASPERVVQQGHLARRERQVGQGRPHRGGHRSEVDRHVIPLRDQAPPGIEQRAGEIATLLDVRRVGAPLQRRPHLLRDRREQVPVDLQPDRVEPSADAHAPVSGCRWR